MRSLFYVLYNACVVVPVSVLSLMTDVRIHLRWRDFVRGFLIVSIPFITWDVWAASEGHWLFSDTYILPQRIWGIPFEEVAFFFTTPVAMMYVWGVIVKYIPKDRVYASKVTATYISYVLITLSSIGVFVFADKGYTRSACAALLLTTIVVLRMKLLSSYRFIVFQGVLLGLFVVFNTILTALPVISYGESSYTGVRVGTIPVEDFLFNAAFLNLFLIVYAKNQLKYKL
jgi:lycopene cyclase domain-containing protein